MDQRHVDIVRNQAHGGYSELVARFFLETVGEEEVIAVAVNLREHWARLVTYLDEPIKTDAGPVYAGKNASEYLAHLHSHLANEYIFATELHSSAECPFTQGWLPMTPVDALRDVPKASSVS